MYDTSSKAQKIFHTIIVGVGTCWTINPVVKTEISVNKKFCSIDNNFLIEKKKTEINSDNI